MDLNKTAEICLDKFGTVEEFLIRCPNMAAYVQFLLADHLVKDREGFFSQLCEQTAKTETEVEELLVRINTACERAMK